MSVLVEVDPIRRTLRVGLPESRLHRRTRRDRHLGEAPTAVVAEQRVLDVADPADLRVLGVARAHQPRGSGHIGEVRATCLAQLVAVERGGHMPLARLPRRHVGGQQITVAVAVEVAEHRAATEAAGVLHPARCSHIPEAALAVVLEQAVMQPGRKVLHGDEYVDIAVVIVVAEGRTRGVDAKILHAALDGLVDEADRRLATGGLQRCTRGDGERGDGGRAPHVRGLADMRSGNSRSARSR